MIKVGDKVRLTAKYLRNTGQQRGGEALSRWTVKGFEGDFVVTDEAGLADYFTADELAVNPSLAYRQIHVDNLEKVRNR